jgi:hypothetical protein
MTCAQPSADPSVSFLSAPPDTPAQVDFDAAATWTTKETFLWRHTLQQTLAGFVSDAECDAALARLTANATLGGLAKGLGLFLRLKVGPWLVAQADTAAAASGASLDGVLARLARAEKCLLASQAAVLAG